MWLLIGICATVVLLWIVGDAYPIYREAISPPSVPSTDLRVSEFAPDLDAVPSLMTRIENETARLNKAQGDLWRQLDRTRLEIYEDAILDIKTRRWKEGNPVTKKNPIDPDEMPPKPYNHF